LTATETFTPPRYLRNAHLQTVLNSQGPRKLRAWRIGRRLASEELVLQAEDGTRLLAELDRAAAGSGRLVILLHGWEGSSGSSYMLTTAARLLGEGYDVLRVNLRDHGDSHHLNRELFNSTRSPEVASALKAFTAEQEYRSVFICGYSLGASFALRIAADSGVEIGIDGVVAISPPVDPARAMDALNSGPRVYEHYFFRKWRDSLRRKLELFPELQYGGLLAGAKSLDDLNRDFIPRHTPYKRLEDYFAAYALYGDRLAAMAMPATIISAEDDPIIPAADFSRIDAIENLNIELHRYGGHCGFIQDLAAHSWAEDRILELLREAGSRESSG
jgi:predicted alpha/beta-fold hydrolase